MKRKLRHHCLIRPNQKQNAPYQRLILPKSTRVAAKTVCRSLHHRPMPIRATLIEEVGTETCREPKKVHVWDRTNDVRENQRTHDPKGQHHNCPTRQIMVKAKTKSERRGEVWPLTRYTPSTRDCLVDLTSCLRP